MNCDGECKKDETCTGKVRTVHVSGNGFKEPFEFNYCDTAIKEDRQGGFKVKTIKSKTRHPAQTAPTP